MRVRIYEMEYLAIAVLILACAPAGDRSASTAPPPSASGSGLTATTSPKLAVGDRQRVQVLSVTDGDTIRVSIEGRSTPVRYIGIDTPETVDPRTTVQCFGQQATAANRRLVEGRTIELEKDVSETDKYDRLLRYVWIDGKMVNEELVRDGYARSSSYPPDVKYQDRFRALEAEARAAGRGLWGAVCAASPTATATATFMPTPRITTPVLPNCDASYPGVCIPSPPPDLDCKDIPYRRFTVRLPDPHKFDQDRDGIGCE